MAPGMPGRFPVEHNCTEDEDIEYRRNSSRSAFMNHRGSLERLHEASETGGSVEDTSRGRCQKSIRSILRNRSKTVEFPESNNRGERENIQTEASVSISSFRGQRPHNDCGNSDDFHNNDPYVARVIAEQDDRARKGHCRRNRLEAEAQEETEAEEALAKAEKMMHDCRLRRERREIEDSSRLLDKHRLRCLGCSHVMLK